MANRRHFLRMLAGAGAGSVVGRVSAEQTLATGTTAQTPPDTVFDGFEDGDYTSNPRWQVEKQEGSIDVVQPGFQSQHALRFSGEGDSNTPFVNILRRPLTESIPEGTVFSTWVKTDGVPCDGYQYQVGTGRALGGNFAHIRLKEGRVDINGTNIYARPLINRISADTWYRLEMEILGGGEVEFRARDEQANLLASLTRNASPNSDYDAIVLRHGNSTSQITRGWFDRIRYAVTTPKIEVAFDIKPCSDPNAINPDSRGVIPVGIKHTADFDPVERVDVSTLRFGAADVVEDGGGATPAHSGHVEDVIPCGGDGRNDLVVHFPTQDTGFDGDEDVGRLEGETKDGTPLVGEDSVKLVGNGPPRGQGRRGGGPRR